MFGLLRSTPALFIKSFSGGGQESLSRLLTLSARKRGWVRNPRVHARLDTHNSGMTVLPVSGYIVKSTKRGCQSSSPASALSPLCWCFIAAKTLKESLRRERVKSLQWSNDFQGCKYLCLALIERIRALLCAVVVLVRVAHEVKGNGEPALRNCSFADLECWTLLQRSTRHRIRWKVRWFR